jgi:hypothetical protein
MFNSFQLRKALSHLRNFVQFSKDYLADSCNQLHKFIIATSLLSRKSFKNFFGEALHNASRQLLNHTRQSILRQALISLG